MMIRILNEHNELSGYELRGNVVKLKMWLNC